MISHRPGDPADFSPFLVEGFYSPDLIELLQEQCRQLRMDPSTQVDSSGFHRKQVHNHPLFVALHRLMLPRAEELFGRKLKPSYVFTSMYRAGEGKCDPHKDRPVCKYTIDVCITEPKGDWPLVAEIDGGVLFASNFRDGDAMLLSGTDHRHWRDGVCPSDADFVFFHFVDPGYDGDLN